MSSMLVFPFDHPHARPADQLNDQLGGKGAGLAMMAGELALPVPAGFTLTTEACDRFRGTGWDEVLEEALRTGIDGLSRAIGATLGDPASPLLVSVRSGAGISMPGMMDTILNVGLDPKTRAALERQSRDFADDCQARFEACWAETVGGSPPDDPWQQLRQAVAAVFGSADSDRARTYRRREGISGPATTAVNVQAMVFGNRDERSGTGVVFSRDPATGAPELYGDILFRAQGEDVVSGRSATRPIAALDGEMPGISRDLREMVERLERRLRDLCEVEFTIESGRLYVLQVRVGKRSPRAALRIAYDLAEDPAFPLDRREAVERVVRHLADPPRQSRLMPPDGGDLPAPWGVGLGASPGLRAGVIQTEIAAALRAAGGGSDVILCRPETSPSDIEGIQAARGLVTASGGLASHAAVVARGWGIPAVVGLAGLEIDAEGISLEGARLAVGSPVTIDGTTGAVFAGSVPIEEETAAEVARLTDWARELGVEIGETRAVSESSETGPESATSATVDEIAHGLSIRGSAIETAIAAMVGLSQASVASQLEAMQAEGWIEPAKPIGLALTALGRERAEALAERDRRSIGNDRARAALEAFQPLDERLKQAVTDWQMRTVAGELLPNDHGDAEWDRGVLDRLLGVVEDAADWLDPLSDVLPRLARYAERLRAAHATAAGGDARFIASPIVDSLHGVWFELHEDLIRLAGSSRAEELAAGRSG